MSEDLVARLRADAAYDEWNFGKDEQSNARDAADEIERLQVQNEAFAVLQRHELPSPWLPLWVQHGPSRTVLGVHSEDGCIGSVDHRLAARRQTMSDRWVQAIQFQVGAVERTVYPVALAEQDFDDNLNDENLNDGWVPVLLNPDIPDEVTWIRASAIMAYRVGDAPPVAGAAVQKHPVGTVDPDDPGTWRA